MGVVYRALDPELGRIVALKLIAPHLAAQPAFRARFTSESLTAAALEHPHALPVYRAGEDAGRLFLAMRFVEGPSLAELIATRGLLPAGLAVRLIEQVAGALDAAHALGLIHRDVKPANILIAGTTGQEHAYLADFGLTVLGRRPRSARRRGRRTTSPPSRSAVEALDARTDVYALGCVLYQCLSGRPPFCAPHDEQIVAAHLSSPPPRASEATAGIAEGLDHVIARAMAKRPQERFATAGALAEAARAALPELCLLHSDADAPAAALIAAELTRQGLESVTLAPDLGAADEERWDALAASRACVLARGCGRHRRLGWR